MKITCTKCGRTKDEKMFYTYRNGEKAQMCKDCTLMHVDIWDPQTFVWLLQKYDVPWLPWEWESLRAKAYAKNPARKNDTTVFGKYLSKMKLKQWKNHSWADTDELQREHELLISQQDAESAEELSQIYTEQFQNGQISQAQYRTLVKASVQKDFDAAAGPKVDQSALVGENNAYNEKNFMSEEQIPDLSKDLTEEDKKYLVMKWGRYYTPQEWVQLETFYNEMMQSFDIQDADTKSTLIIICKNTLKMNQALDQGDLEGYQKLARVSDTLRKSAKFTAAQNKQKSNDFIDSIGQLVDYCQKNGGAIPQFSIDSDLDVIDTIIKDLKTYTKTLIYEDPALKRQIEDYLKKIKNNQQMKNDKKEAEAKGLDYVEVTDEDIISYNNQIKEQKIQDDMGSEKDESTTPS